MHKIWNTTPNSDKCMEQQEFPFTACGDEMAVSLWKIGKEGKHILLPKEMTRLVSL